MSKYGPALVVPALWFISAGLCYLVCRIRHVQVTAVQSFIIAGLPLALGAVPIPLPYLLHVAAQYAMTVYVTMKYLGVSLFPEGLLIPGITFGGSLLLSLAF